MRNLIQKGIINSEDLQNVLSQRDTGKEAFIIVDVREEGEYNMSHIKGVDILKPLSAVEEWIDILLEETKDMIVIFTCHSGARSADIQKIFNEKGHQNTLNHIGGIASYRGEIVR